MEESVSFCQFPYGTREFFSFCSIQCSHCTRRDTENGNLYCDQLQKWQQEGYPCRFYPLATAAEVKAFVEKEEVKHDYLVTIQVHVKGPDIPRFKQDLEKLRYSWLLERARVTYEEEKDPLKEIENMVNNLHNHIHESLDKQK